MSRWLALTLAVVLVACGCLDRSSEVLEPPFQVWDLYIEVQHPPLSAWQLDLAATGEPLQIVGVEGGDHAGFHDPPFYDPTALAGGHLVLASFDTGGGLPVGEHRVATLHVRRIEGPDGIQLSLPVAAGPAGQAISARATLRARPTE